jgi:microcin C transport system substrate-binding protein
VVARLLGALIAALLLQALPAWGAHAIAWGESPKYPADFTHFDYVNPDAPRGGRLNLHGWGTFDKLNPFTLKGIALSGVETLMFETLAEASEDEPASMYGLLAEDIDFAPDRLSITFRLHPDARFSDGSPVLAADVRHSFETLTGKYAHPRFRQYFTDVARVVVVDTRVVRFEFKRRNHELHMILGTQLPVFSRAWGEGKPFDTVVQDPPIASGPYVLQKLDWGRSATFVLNPDWWAGSRPVRKGMFNFERITWKYFKDDTSRLEGFKAGEFDWILETSAKSWARGHRGWRYAAGSILKREFRHSNAAGIQGFAMNTRRPMFRDVRVRQALTLALDFEWMNRQMFYDQYARSPSYFTNSVMQAEGAPEPDEVDFMLSLGVPVLPEAFAEVPMPPTTAPPGSLRDNLREAVRLLAEAGWVVDDQGVLRGRKGEPFEFEVLTYSRSLQRLAVPWARNLEKLGIRVRQRIVDLALYQRREDQFDFDVVIQSYGAGQIPGNELSERFGSRSARVRGSDNLSGVRDPAVDAAIARLLQSQTRGELVTAARVLDRLLRHGWYLVPHFHAPTHRVAYWDKLAYPERLPRYYNAESWMLKTWWMARR